MNKTRPTFLLVLLIAVVFALGAICGRLSARPARPLILVVPSEGPNGDPIFERPGGGELTT